MSAWIMDWVPKIDRCGSHCLKPHDSTGSAWRSRRSSRSRPAWLPGSSLRYEPRACTLHGSAREDARRTILTGSGFARARRCGSGVDNDPAGWRGVADPTASCRSGGGESRLRERRSARCAGRSSRVTVSRRAPAPRLLRSGDHRYRGSRRASRPPGRCPPSSRWSGQLDALHDRGRPAAAPGQELYAPFRVATPHYFGALHIPLRTRPAVQQRRRETEPIPVIRWFPQQPYPAGFDTPQSPPVAIVSEAAAHQYFREDPNPVGQRIRVLFSPDITIVGVVGDIKHNALNLPSFPHIYLSHDQEPWNSVSLVGQNVRSAGQRSPRPCVNRFAPRSRAARDRHDDGRRADGIYWPSTAIRGDHRRLRGRRAGVWRWWASSGS